MIRQRLEGDDLAAYLKGLREDTAAANTAAPRRTAFRAARELRALIKKRFSTNGRVYAAPGWAKAIRVDKMSDREFHVADKATYTRGRTMRVGLAWVFDNAPVISGKKGWTAVPIQGAAPIHRTGRRYMWPSEADKAGYQLEIANVMGKRFKVIFGRLNRFDPWRAMWLWIPPYRAKKALDLNSLHARHAAQIDALWGDELDARTSKRARKKL
ncbi:hypothetical protein V7S57_02455 [Caulobacter sp. CCNWLY153]|uniref:hypothetical protein n=1 Tax=unclassified Caulobacter TaxID=2648921 RepID=UPI002FEFDC52